MFCKSLTSPTKCNFKVIASNLNGLFYKFCRSWEANILSSDFQEYKVPGRVEQEFIAAYADRERQTEKTDRKKKGGEVRIESGFLRLLERSLKCSVTFLLESDPY